ncbi:MAG: peptidoglycan-binding domain-containing protein [Chitinophagaceae bacterium]
MKTRKTNIKSRATRQSSSKKKQTKKIIVASVAISAAGILGYFGWQYFKKKREAKKTGDLDMLLQSGIIPSTSGSTATIPTYTPPYVPPYVPPVKPATSNSNSTYSSSPAGNNTAASGFPLKKGSKGSNVRLLQQALISKYGKSILPKYGADGDFGSETVAALKKAGLPITINESTFYVLTQGSKPESGDIGKGLYNAAAAKNYSKVLSLLKQMQSVDDYTKANEVFKQYRLGAVRQTIVNGLLNTFASTAQKEAIRLEFLRMGLQYDGSKWSLSGLDGLPVMTTEPTTVWINAAEGVKVPARMVLGNEVSKRLDYTLFENGGKYFLVQTKSIRYLQ